MFGSEMLDVAIGMIFIYLLVSLICSAANELIDRQLKNRATDLERGIRELLDDKDGTGLVTHLYQHGMTNGLFKGNYDPAAKDKSNLPSYIPSRNFALAILGIVAPQSPAVSLRDSVAKIENAKVKNALHSDQGVQYACREYMEKLRHYRMVPSMSRPANPYDNATCESFLKTLKREEIHAGAYRDLEDLRERVEEFIER